MKASELRAKDVAGLEKEVADLLKAHFGLRMQKATQQLTNHSPTGQDAPRHRARQDHPGREEEGRPEMNPTQTAQRRQVATAPKAKNTRTLVGRVVSDKRAKTITVLIERRTKHELYGKIVARNSKYHAHDENGEYKLGDIVEIAEGAPDLEDQVLGRDTPGAEGHRRLTPALASRRLGSPVHWRPGRRFFRIPTRRRSC